MATTLKQFEVTLQNGTTELVYGTEAPVNDRTLYIFDGSGPGFGTPCVRSYDPEDWKSARVVNQKCSEEEIVLHHKQRDTELEKWRKIFSGEDD